MARDFLKQIKEHQNATPRVAIQQIDPGDTESRPVTPTPPAVADQKPADSPALGSSVPPQAIEEPPQLGGVAPEGTGTPGRESNSDAAPAPAAERPLYLTPVDTKEKPFNRGFHMYPSRHKQLRDLAYYEDRDPWEVVDQALAEYVKRHYGGKAGK